MKKYAYTYLPSKMVAGEGEFLRKHSFTRWMSAAVLQASTDCLRNMRMFAIYAECSPTNQHRYLLWNPPEKCGIEVRSGRTQAQFEEYDQANVERGLTLVSLHLNDLALYSAVWISSEHVKAAHRVLNSYGITPASQMLVT